MARETKAQRNAREAEEAAQREDQERLEYGSRLMAALGFATAQGWRLEVRDGRFCVRVPDTNLGNDDGEHELDHAWSTDAVNALGMLELDVESEQKRIEERAQRDALRRQGRAKLTEDEARALGV